MESLLFIELKRESETRAAELIRNLGHKNIKRPNPDLRSDQSLQLLSSSGENQLVDAVLIYMTVAAGNQYARIPQSVPLDSLKELVVAVSSDKLKKIIYKAFSSSTLNKWLRYQDENLRELEIQIETEGSALVSPGCIEFTTSEHLWVMFKTNWSPARIYPGCGNPTR